MAGTKIDNEKNNKPSFGESVAWLKAQAVLAVCLGKQRFSDAPLRPLMVTQR